MRNILKFLCIGTVAVTLQASTDRQERVAGVSEKAPKVHRDILVNGKDNLFDNVDFNAKYGVDSGDIVILKGSYGAIRFKKIVGVTFQGEGLVNATTIKFYPDAGGKDCSVIGDPAYKYGIRIKGPQFGVEYYQTGTTTLQGISTDGNSTGVKIVHAENGPRAYNFLDLTMKNVRTAYGSLEGYYIGASDSKGVQINLKMDSCDAVGMGWDGIQCRVGNFNINNCNVDSCGRLNVQDQNHAFLIGSNTSGAVIRNCRATNTPGLSLFDNGSGRHIIECNYFENSIMAHNYQAKLDFQKMGFLDLVIRNNTILGKADGKALMVYDNSSLKYPITLDYSNNKTSGSSVIHAGVKSVIGQNNLQVVPACRPVEKKVKKTVRVYSDGSVETN